MKLLPASGERLLPLLTGALLVLSFPPFALLLPPFVALVPLLVFIAALPAGRNGRWAATRAGFWAGLVYFGLLLYWMIVALVYYSRLAVPAYVLTVLILAGSIGLFASLLHHVRERLPAVPFALSAALLWTAIEWLQGHLGDLSFPWLGLGSSLTAFPRVAGAADLVGARGLTFWLVLVNGVLAVAFLRARERRPWTVPAAVAALLVAAPVAYGFVRAAQLEVTPVAEVAVVQPNIPEDLKLDRSRAVDSSLTALANLTQRVPASADLIVWPEVALPALVLHTSQRELFDTVRALSRGADAPIVAGLYGYEGDDRDDLVFFNSAIVVAPEGVRGPQYSKQFLVPFVERVPFLDPALLERFTGDLRYFGGLGRGGGEPVLEVDGARFGILICYESIFAQLSRRYRLAGADFLVNITNDAWYGREPWWARTSALWQHPAHLVMRAIENRVGIARSANTGISMFIDPLGRTYERTALFEPDVRTATVGTTAGLTLFTRWGDWLATGATAGALALLLAAWLLGRRAGAGVGVGVGVGTGAGGAGGVGGVGGEKRGGRLETPARNL